MAGRHRAPAAHIGRASALAVALGIGAAIAGGTGVAHAEGSGSDGPGASGAKSTASNGNPTPKAAATSTPPARELAGLAKRVAAALHPGGPAAPGTHSAAAGTRARTTIQGRTGTTTRGSATESAPPAKPNAAPATKPNAAPAAKIGPAPAAKPDVVATLVSTARTVPPTAAKPVPQPPALLGALQLVRREIEHARLSLMSPTPQATPVQPPNVQSTATTAPNPTDDAATAYGDIGKWMLQPNGQISNYGGQPYRGKTLLEPVNVIIVDPRSSSPEESASRLNNAMFRSGFPAQPIHSTGFRGTIDDVTYSQQPIGPLLGYSDNSFLLPNDHGRIFGPDPVQTSTGYVWSGAFSTEQLGLYGLLLTHTYVSSNAARNALATRLVMSGQATYGGVVPLNNAYNTDTTTTGDHDGYAVVLVLR